MHASSASQWVLASNNAGKLREFQALFAPLGIQWVGQGRLGIPACPEPHHTFIENALQKARHASAHSKLPALADDSGLCVPALNGAPGVLSARYARVYNGLGQHLQDSEGNSADEENNQCLLHALKQLPIEDHATRRAFYVCAMVWVAHADDPTPVVAQRFWWGEIAHNLQGTGGFGYDALFWLPEHNATVAQLDSKVKNIISHRALATKALLQELQARGVLHQLIANDTRASCP